MSDKKIVSVGITKYIEELAVAVNSLGERSHTNLLRYGKRCDSHKGGDRGRSDLRNACRRMNHVEYSHAKDIAARIPSRHS